MSSSFRDTGPFSKLPYLGIKLGHWQKFHKLHIYSFYPRGSKWSLFSLYGQRFPRYRPIFKIAIFGMKLAHWPKLHIHTLYTPGGRNWVYFQSTGSSSWYMGRFSKLPCLGINLGHWQTFQQFYIYSTFHPNGLKLSLFFALCGAVSEIQAHFQNCHIWASNLAIGQC